MNRGVITLTKEELLALCKVYDFTNEEYKQLGVKLRAGLGGIQESNDIFVSQDELEFILDEVGFVSPTEDPVLNALTTKITEAISKLEGN